MLSRKHYFELAQVIADSKEAGDRLSLEVAIIDWLQHNNPRFDRQRFRDAIQKFEKQAATR
jgi:hypothetical protein